MRQLYVLLVVFFLSLGTSIYLILDETQPSGYEMLFFLPLSFGIVSVLFNRLYFFIPNNLAITLIVFLSFCRMVLSPLMMGIGNYTSTINLNVEYNLFHAIILMVYELIAVFATLFFLSQTNNENNRILEGCRFTSLDKQGKKKYLGLILALLLVLVCCFYITPHLKDMYRPIIQANEEFFTYTEDSYFIAKYGTSFVSKLSMVVGMYIMRLMLLAFPAMIIVLCYESRKRNVLISVITMGCCLIPLFFVGGAIARSLIYVFCLFLLRTHLFSKNAMGNKIFVLGLIAVVFILLWWGVIRENKSLSLYGLYSTRMSAYFTGVNIVSGSFNLPSELTLRIKYFLYDFLSTMPFGHTIWGINDQTIMQFFNRNNFSFGQIPTTIGMGWYYFGDVFAPIYSIAFAFFAFKSFASLEKKDAVTPFQYVRLIYSTFVFSMGIVMYNIEITMLLVYGVILPLFILEKIAYDKRDCCFIKTLELDATTEGRVS